MNPREVKDLPAYPPYETVRRFFEDVRTRDRLRVLTRLYCDHEAFEVYTPEERLELFLVIHQAYKVVHCAERGLDPASLPKTQLELDIERYRERCNARSSEV